MAYLQGVMDKIVVKLLVIKEKKTESGIILTEEVAQKQEPQSYGVVVSYGKDIPFEIKEGDVLLFHNRAGMDIILDKVIYKVLKSDEVYGTLKNEVE